MGDNLYWVWLSRCCFGRSGVLDRLLRVFPRAVDVYRAEPAEIETALGGDTVLATCFANKDLSDAQQIMDYCMMADVGILTYGSPAYPSRLKMLEDPPLVLYYKGTLPDFETGLFLAVVGTRRMSEYGKRMTYEISSDLARAGVTVVTGMALGIDGLASASALSAGGRTVAFLGSGIDIAYPREHAYLMQAIAHHGVVITEYAPGTRPERRNFPYRNRLISGISQGVLVVEGSENSGSLITARYALQQGKDLFALPGNADEENSESTTYLLKNGASAISCADDLIQRYTFLYGNKVNIFNLLKGKRNTADRVMAAYHIASAPYVSRSHRDPLAEGNRYGDGGREDAARVAPVSPTKTKKAHVETHAETAVAETEEPRRDTHEKLRLLDAATIAIYQKMPLGRAVLIDELCGADTPVECVTAAMTMLEIHHLVTQVAGGRYIRV